jgi:NADPH:quinone reductase-like Zn-dependent oxidoreductase
MKAIVLSRYGSPDDLRLEDISRPEPSEGEVLVRVHYSSVNDWDWSLLRGKPYLYRLLIGLYGLLKPKVAVMGAEVAGIVEACGRNTSGFQPGDRVFGDVSMAGFGGFAEYVAVDENALGPVPAEMTFEQAVALPHAGMLAVQGLIDIGQIRESEKILINGAGGGVGIIAVQIAKQYGCEVTGVDSAAKLDALKSVGFDHVLDYRQTDFTSTGEQYDLILDTKTTRSPFRHLRALNTGGRYVTVGGDVPRILQTLMMGPLIARFSSKSARLVALKTNKDLDYLNQMFDQGGMKFVIDGPYPLSELPKAMRRFGQARHIGKIVIRVIQKD